MKMERETNTNSNITLFHSTKGDNQSKVTATHSAHNLLGSCMVLFVYCLAVVAVLGALLFLPLNQQVPPTPLLSLSWCGSNPTQLCPALICSTSVARFSSKPCAAFDPSLLFSVALGREAAFRPRRPAGRASDRKHTTTTRKLLL